jgi:hypothetical protein
MFKNLNLKQEYHKSNLLSDAIEIYEIIKKQVDK